ncbi:hypothetical protein KM043_007202 [Ampulex compressa]|nr:hypothetical protein KM043_007202 [Ampulex compressa]
MARERDGSRRKESHARTSGTRAYRRVHIRQPAGETDREKAGRREKNTRFPGSAVDSFGADARGDYAEETRKTLARVFSPADSIRASRPSHHGLLPSSLTLTVKVARSRSYYVGASSESNFRPMVDPNSTMRGWTVRSVPLLYAGNIEISRILSQQSIRVTGKFCRNDRRDPRYVPARGSVTSQPRTWEFVWPDFCRYSPDVELVNPDTVINVVQPQTPYERPPISGRSYRPIGGATVPDGRNVTLRASERNRFNV